MSVERLTHIGLCVSDLPRARRFYEEALGFEAVSELSVSGAAAATLLGLPGVELEALYLARDGFVLELLHYPVPGATGDGAPRAMNALGFTHLSVRVDDLEAALARIEAHGGRRLPETAVAIAANATAVAFASDPDGVRIELVQAPGDPSRLPGRPVAGSD